MKESKVIDKNTLDNRCPSCGASINFNPKSGKWKCDYCNSEFTMEEMKKKSNAAKDVNNNVDVEDDNNNYVSYKCQSCGAEIVADEATSATFCVYCGNSSILKGKLSGKFHPDMVIPFKKDKKAAENAFKNILKGRPLAPKSFNSLSNIEKIRGIYIPFWLYDINVSGTVDCEAERVKKWRSGDTHYTRVDYYHTSRTGEMNYLLVPVDGSTRFDNDIMNTIEPFNYSDLVEYNHAYLSGFYAEKYDVEANDAFLDAAGRSLNTSEVIMKNDGPPYTTKYVINNTLEAKMVSKKYVLLPVWMVNVKFDGKMYIFAMNGQTGKFIGNIPVHFGKTMAYFVVIFIVLFLLGLLISYLLWKGGVTL